MGTENILSLIGGLSLFLYGMQMMSRGLEAAAGNRMKRILERLVSNRFAGVLVGALITAVIQSSSATTVMVVGFVNSGIMTLNQAVWVIMGANIGTTITSQLIALDIGMLAPIFSLCGVIMILFLRDRRFHYAGEIIAGLGVLFIGMGMMSSSMLPLRDSAQFIRVFASFANPLIGIAVGALFTALIQSSSASVGILQAMAMSGVIGLNSAVYVIFGQNIGTCVTAALASIGTNRYARRTAVIHFLFNIFGTVLFVLICAVTPFVSWMQSLTLNNPAAQIANVLTIFNVTTTIVLLPFGKKLIHIAERVVPEKVENEQKEKHLLYLNEEIVMNEHQIGSVAIALSQIEQELDRMMAMAFENVRTAFSLIRKNDDKKQAEIIATEEYIDYLNEAICAFISRIVSVEMPAEDSTAMSICFKMSGDIERMGDHAMNIAEHAQYLADHDLKFSELAMTEVELMEKLSFASLQQLEERLMSAEQFYRWMEEEEKRFDEVTAEFRYNQIERMKQNICTGEACVVYSELLTDFERLGDHLLNLAEEAAILRPNQKD